MAIRHVGEDKKPVKRENRDRIHPFLDRESAIKALQEFIGNGTDISRASMYTLEIINNLISSNNGQQNLYQRIPPEIFGGLPEGGRRNVQASALARANVGADAEKSRTVRKSGYTEIQEIIGHWAERDGSWHDYPEHDLEKAGMRHGKDMDGSEARIFTNKKTKRVYKTIDFSHYNAFELMMDRIAIHNATFPETAMRVEGFGVRDDAIKVDSDFVVIISQPFVEGTTPTPEQIEDGMSVRGYDKTENGFFFVSRLDNTAIADIHDENAVISPEGNLLVFDNEAFLKQFPVDPLSPERIPMNEFLPQKDGKFPTEPWNRLLGEKALTTGNQEKSTILKQLRLTGKYNGLVGGKIVMLENAYEKVLTNPDGSKMKYFDGDISFGYPNEYKKETLYKVPPIQYDEQSVRDIKDEIARLLPLSIPLEQFLHDPELVGQYTAAFRGGTDIRNSYKEQLKKTGRIEGLVNDRFIVQKDSENPGNVLISTKDKLEFLLWTNGTKIPGTGILSEQNKKNLAEGKYITTPKGILYFNIDKGRVDLLKVKQLKLIKQIDNKAKAVPEQKPSKIKL